MIIILQREDIINISSINDLRELRVVEISLAKSTLPGNLIFRMVVLPEPETTSRISPSWMEGVLLSPTRNTTFANLGHIHAQNTSDIARTAPTGNEHTVCLGYRFCQSIYLCRIDLGANPPHGCQLESEFVWYPYSFSFLI